MADTARSQKVIKVFLSNDEQDVVRLAAALRRMSMAEYARTVVVEDARRATAKINFAELQVGQKEGVQFKQQTRAKRSRRRVKLLPRDDISN